MQSINHIDQPGGAMAGHPKQHANSRAQGAKSQTGIKRSGKKGGGSKGIAKPSKPRAGGHHGAC